MISVTRYPFIFALALLLPVGPVACDGDSDSATDTNTGGGSGGDGVCSVTPDCETGLICVTIGQGGPGACTPQCSASANECGGMASCSGVGALSVNVCKDDPASPDDPPDPEDEPRIPCTTDAECDALTSGAICVEWKGIKDCTIACTQESDCDLPSAGGVTIDFLECLDDEADASRMGCVPDEDCFNNPSSCVTFPGL